MKTLKLKTLLCLSILGLCNSGHAETPFSLMAIDPALESYLISAGQHCGVDARTASVTWLTYVTGYVSNIPLREKAIKAFNENNGNEYQAAISKIICPK